MKPKVLIIRHFDRWPQPMSHGIPRANMNRARRFERAIHEVDRGIKVIIPDFVKTYTLE
ncbi:MAG TPA: hypothetical protein VGB25_07940 [Candidatus Binatia bacterium]